MQRLALLDRLAICPWLLAIAMTAPLCAAERQAPSPPREFRAAWVATVANIDWPSRPGLSTAEQQLEARALLDKAAELHLNAIVFQVRPCADALYESKLEPWSEFLTGQMGHAPKPFYDPLEFFVKEAHARGLELHAWFNPYRALHPIAKSALSDDHVSKAHPNWVRTYGKYLWLDPGEPAAVDHTVAVVSDVVRRYDIDGVHLDDYFYPYPIKDDEGNEVPFPDDASWAQFTLNHTARDGEQLSRDDWRRQNVDRLVERLHRGIKKIKPWVKFGISPFGIWRPGHPKTIQGFDPYEKLYADSRKWFHEGWVDYYTPQLYWPIDQTPQSYPVLLKWWHEQNKQGRHLWPGNFISRVGKIDSRKQWPVDEIVRQIEITRAQPGATGNVHFSMKALTKNYSGVADRLLAGPYHTQALVPSSPWMTDPSGTLRSKLVVSIDKQKTQTILHMRLQNAKSPWLWVVRARYGSEWTLAIVPGKQSEYRLDSQIISSGPTAQLAEVAVSPVNRIGAEGAVVSLSLSLKVSTPDGH